MTDQVQSPIVETEPPVNTLFDPNTTYTYIPWRMLTRQMLDECMIVKNLVENKKFNLEAQGQSIWTKFNLKKFKLHYPGFKAKLNDDKLCWRTPFMNTPFGISKFPKKDDETISLSYGRAKDEDVEAFADWARDVFDAFMIDKITENSKAWLGTAGNRELVAAVYSGLYRFTEEDDSKGYAAKTPGFKLMRKDGAYQAKAYRGDRAIPLNKETIHSNDYLQMDVELSTLWFLKPRCGISGTIARVDQRTGEEMMNDGYACNPPKPEDVAGATQETPAPPATENQE